MISDHMGAGVGQVRVETSSNSGHSPEFYAERLISRLIAVSHDAPPEIRQQALAYQESMRSISLDVIRRAILSDRTTSIYHLKTAGMHEAADLIWKLGT